MILQTDNEPWCCDVLRKNFPNDEVWQRDIRDIDPADLDGYHECHFFAGIGGFRLGLQWAGWDREIWTGGFPCQDISVAGKGAGLDGERSGLWWEWLRLIRARRPVRLLIENVPALRSRGADAVLGSLEELGYTCWPVVVGAVHAGGFHRRGRCWIAANAHGGNNKQQRRTKTAPRKVETPLSNANTKIQPRVSFDGEERHGLSESDCGTTRIRRPNMGGVADGIPRRVDRLRGLGNAVVPQVVEMIARAWMKAEAD